jgi:hypothetical protein
VGSLRAGQRKKHGTLGTVIYMFLSLSLSRGKKSKLSLQNVFPPAGGFIIDRAAKRKHDTLPGHAGFSLSGKQVYSPKRFFPALRIVSLSEKQVYPPKRFFPALRILSLSLSLSLSEKNKFTVQNVCPLPLRSLLTGQREESMVLCPTI